MGYSYGYRYTFNSKGGLVAHYNFADTYQLNNQMYAKNLGEGEDLALFSAQGVDLNGSNQYVPIPSDSFTTVATDMSFVCTFKINAFKSSNRLHDYNNTLSGSRHFLIQVNQSDLQIYNGSSFVSIKNDIALDTEYRLIANYDDTANTVVITIDGSELITIPMSYTFAVHVSAKGQLGSSWDGNSNFFNGTIKDVYRFSRLLNIVEKTLYLTNPNQFFDEALLDVNKSLIYPLSESGDSCYDYATGTFETIASFDTTVRTDAEKQGSGSQNDCYLITNEIRTERISYDKSLISRLITPQNYWSAYSSLFPSTLLMIMEEEKPVDMTENVVFMARTGTEHHIDNVNGVDASSGRGTESAPYKTYQYVNDNKVTKGDTIILMGTTPYGLPTEMVDNNPLTIDTFLKATDTNGALLRDGNDNVRGGKQLTPRWSARSTVDSEPSSTSWLQGIEIRPYRNTEGVYDKVVFDGLNDQQTVKTGANDSAITYPYLDFYHMSHLFIHHIEFRNMWQIPLTFSLGHNILVQDCVFEDTESSAVRVSNNHDYALETGNFGVLIQRCRATRCSLSSAQETFSFYNNLKNSWANFNFIEESGNLSTRKISTGTSVDKYDVVIDRDVWYDDDGNSIAIDFKNGSERCGAKYNFILRMVLNGLYIDARGLIDGTVYAYNVIAHCGNVGLVIADEEDTKNDQSIINTQVYGNLSIFNKFGYVIGWDGKAPNAINNLDFFNNTGYKNSIAGLRVGTTDTDNLPSVFTNGSIRNCIFSLNGCGTSGTDVTTTSDQIQFGRGGTLGDAKIQNMDVGDNILHSDDSEEDVSIVFPTSAITSTQSNNKNIDPLFVDAENYDFRLKTGSYAIGKGTDTDFANIGATWHG